MEDKFFVKELERFMSPLSMVDKINELAIKCTELDKLYNDLEYEYNRKVDMCKDYNKALTIVTKENLNERKRLDIAYSTIEKLQAEVQRLTMANTKMQYDLVRTGVRL